MLPINKEIQKIISEAGGEWGIYSKNLKTDDVLFELNAENEFPSASVGKMPIALYVFSQIASGKAFFDDEMILNEDMVLGGSGVLRHLHLGLKLNLLDVLSLMLITSDNTAAKMLVRKFTPEKINEYMNSLGFKFTSLKIDGDKFGFGMSTPREMSNLLEGLYKNTYFSQEISEKFIDILRNSDGDDRIRRYLPHDKYNEQVKLKVANKGGSIPGVRNDVGIIYENEPYTLCVYCKDLPDESYKVDNKGVLAIAEISKLIYAEHIKSQ